MCITLGGAAVVLSAFIPWVSASDNVILLHPTPTGGAQADIAIFGAALVFVGVRILMDSARRWSQVVLWLLSVLGGISVAGIFSSLNDNSNFRGGTVQPAGGLFLAVGGVIAAVVGTLLFQTVRLPNKATQAVAVAVAPVSAVASTTLSPDKQYWWDGALWRSVADAPPPASQRSPDGNYWWDGSVWRTMPSAILVST
jgi:hypothetical protein